MTLDMIGGSTYQPKKFIEGLNYWRNDLTNSSATKLDDDSSCSLSTQANDTLGSLILTKNSNTKTIAYGSITPLIAGQYLEISFKIRHVSGSAPTAKIVGAATTSSGTFLPANNQNGPETDLISGVEIEISAIVGTGARPGVDLVWQPEVEGGYFGLEFTGSNGGTVLIQDMKITDVSASFLSLHSGLVDIRDYGAIGDGTTDCRDAIIDADNAADGRTLFVPEGDFYIASSLTIQSAMMCKGRLIAADTTPIMLIHRYDLETYVYAFKSEEIAFRKAFQALFYFSDHNILDLRGRRVQLTQPVRFKELLPDITSVTYQRTICNGEVEADSSTNWNDIVVETSASYSNSQNSAELTNINNVAEIEIGSHVYGTGVGREVYVIARDTNAKTLTLNRPLHNAPSNQTYTFTRFQFIIDFCEIENLQYFEMTNIRFLCKKRASLIMLAKEGTSCKMMHLWVQTPKDRGVCSYYQGCNGLTVESCNFQSHQWSIEASERTTIAISTKKPDMKIRNNRATYFRHFAVMGGSGHVIIGNHFFQDNPNGGNSRTAGIVTTGSFAKTLYVGNYVDNCWIELSQEHHDEDIIDSSTFMGYLTVTGNIFALSEIQDGSSFAFIKLRPFGNDVSLLGVSVTGNVFANFGPDSIESAEAIVGSDGNIDWSKTREVTFSGNTWRGIDRKTASPLYTEISRSSSAKTWTENFVDQMPFGGTAKRVMSVVANGDLTSNYLPKVSVQQGSSQQDVTFSFPDSTKGSLTVGVTIDS